MSNITLSLRGNNQVIGLFNFMGQQYLPQLSKSEILTEAINYVVSTRNINWLEVAKIKNGSDFSEYCAADDIPGFLQLRVDAGNWAFVSDYIAKGFNPPLKKLQTPFLIKIIMVAFLENLNSIKNNTENESFHSTNSVFEVSEIMKDFIDMAMYGSNSEEFIEVTKLIVKWKKNR